MATGPTIRQVPGAVHLTPGRVLPVIADGNYAVGALLLPGRRALLQGVRLPVALPGLRPSAGAVATLVGVLALEIAVGDTAGPDPGPISARTDPLVSPI